jgi:hypothetical protein
MASKTVTTPENKARVLELIGEGLSVREICRQDDMPSLQTVYNWIEKDKDFVDRYARATTLRTDAIFDEIEDIADGDGDVARDRLRVDARKWSLSKMQPKKYGDRLEIDGEVATTVVHRTFHQPKPKGIE